MLQYIETVLGSNLFPTPPLPSSHRLMCSFLIKRQCFRSSTQRLSHALKSNFLKIIWKIVLDIISIKGFAHILKIKLVLYVSS